MDDWNKRGSLKHGHAEPADDAEVRARRRRAREEKHKQVLDDHLERGLEDTFPGSDPVAVTQPPSSPRDKRGP